MRLESSLRGRVVRNGERWEAISVVPDMKLELNFISPTASMGESVAVVKVDDRWRTFEADDVESKMSLLEARVAWLEKEMNRARTALRDEKENRLLVEKALRECLDRMNESSSSTTEGEIGELADIFPSNLLSKIRDYSSISADTILEKGAAYREWTRLGYDPVLVAAMFGDTARLEWLEASGNSLLTLGAANESCLYLACEFGHIDALQWLIARLSEKSVARLSETDQTVEKSSKRNSEKNRRNSEKNRRKIQLVLPNGSSHGTITSSTITKSRQSSQNSTLNALKSLRSLRHRENGLSCLGAAVANGHLPLVSWLLSHGWFANELMEFTGGSSDGDTLLHIAARYGQKDAISALINISPDLVFISNHARETPLHTAAKYGQCNVIQSLLDHGLSIEDRDEMNLSPFLAAVNAGHLPVVQILLNLASDKSVIAGQHRDGDGSTGFIIACFRGHLELAAFLLENGSKIDETNASGNNALAVAAFRGDERVVKFLLSRFGRPDGWNFAIPNGKISGKLKNSNESLDGRKEAFEHRRDVSNGSTKSPDSPAPEGHMAQPLHASSSTLDANLDSLSRSSSSPMIPRVSSNPLIAQQLGNFKNLVNAVNEAGNTPMLLAAYGGHLGVLQALHKFGVSITQSNHLGCTPLLIACLYGHEETVIWCVKRGANIHDKDVIGISPIIASAMAGCPSILTFLLEHGANLNDTTDELFSALHMAAYCGRATTVHHLLALGLSPLAPTSNGSTALMLAAINGHLETLQVLISYGMTVNDRLRAAKLAESKGFGDIADYLRTRAYSRDLSNPVAH